jgi:hypothetical protein
VVPKRSSIAKRATNRMQVGVFDARVLAPNTIVPLTIHDDVEAANLADEARGMT